MKIGIIGDALIDRWWVGEASGLSAEGPIPVVKVLEKFDRPGGAANVRINLRDLGCDAVMLFKGLQEKQNYPIKNRLVVGGVQVARWDEGDFCVPFIKMDLLPLTDCDAIVVADYGKGAITPEIVGVLKQLQLPVFVDTKADPREWMGSEAWFFPNLKEYKTFQQAYDWMPNVVLKQGSEGVSLMNFGHVVLTRPSQAKGIKSVCGAGDTVLAGFVNTYLSGCNLDYCLEFAMAAAAVVCEKDFTSTATYDEIQAKLSERKE